MFAREMRVARSGFDPGVAQESSDHGKSARARDVNEWRRS